MTDKIIIYPSEFDCENNQLIAGATILVLRPTNEGMDSHKGDVIDFAEKHVPELHPFFALTNADLPEETEWEAAWTADFTDPHGYGLGPAMYELRKQKQESEQE